MNTPFILNESAFDLFDLMEKHGKPENRDAAKLVIPVIAFGRDDVERESGRKFSDPEWADYLDMERTAFSA